MDRSCSLAARSGALLALLALGGAAQAEGSSPGDAIFTLSPTFWAAGVDSDLGLHGLDFSIDDRNRTGLLGAEYRTGGWSLLAEAGYLDYAQSESGPAPLGGRMTATAEVTERLFMLGAARTVMEGPQLRLDLLAGLRHLKLEQSLTMRMSSSVGKGSEEASWTDPLIGVRGEVGLGGHWFIPFQFDVVPFGSGSDSAWQGSAALGYRLEWGDVTLGYRRFDYDYSEDGLEFDGSHSGMTLGLSLHF